jgi:hypothetical protein
MQLPKYRNFQQTREVLYLLFVVAPVVLYVLVKERWLGL